LVLSVGVAVLGVAGLRAVIVGASTIDALPRGVKALADEGSGGAS
jgi:hypothetical protein